MLIGTRRIDLHLPIPRVTSDDVVQYVVEDAILLRVTLDRLSRTGRKARRDDALAEAMKRLKERRG